MDKAKEATSEVLDKAKDVTKQWSEPDKATDPNPDPPLPIRALTTKLETARNEMLRS